MKRFPEEKNLDANLLRHLISDFTGKNQDSETDHPFYQTMFKALIENAPVGMYILENESFLYVNSFFANLLGYETEQLSSGEVPFEKIFRPEDFATIQKRIEMRSAGLETETRYRIRMIRKNHGRIYTEIHASARAFVEKNF